MLNHRISNHFRKGIRILEYIICALIGIAVICGLPNLVLNIRSLLDITSGSVYVKMGDFLRLALLLVVGIELIIMLITHSHKALLTLVLFVIARKMLVYAESMTDIFIGSVSIAVIFLVLHFLAGNEKLLADFENTFAASVPLKKLRIEYGINLSGHSDTETLGGLVYRLFQEENAKLQENHPIHHDQYILTIVSLQAGVIQQVRIDEEA